MKYVLATGIAFFAVLFIVVASAAEGLRIFGISAIAAVLIVWCVYIITSKEPPDTGAKP